MIDAHAANNANVSYVIAVFHSWNREFQAYWPKHAIIYLFLTGAV